MPIYLYGLQRSGTNVISAWLKSTYNIEIQNELISHDRNSILHKHCRIYNNKKIIPNTDVEKQYYNDYKINSIKDLDKLLENENNDNKYILIYKDIYSWLLSIENWAKKCKWITNKKELFIKDYLEYINKWNKIKNNRVLTINYFDFLKYAENKNSNFISNINSFLGNEINNSKIPDKVMCSNKFNKNRRDYYLKKEYLKLYSENEINQINLEIIKSCYKDNFDILNF